MKFLYLLVLVLVLLSACKSTHVNVNDVSNGEQNNPEWMLNRSNYPEVLETEKDVKAFAKGRLTGCQIPDDKITVEAEETGWIISCKQRTLAEHHIDQYGVWVKQSERSNDPFNN